MDPPFRPSGNKHITKAVRDFWYFKFNNRGANYKYLKPGGTLVPLMAETGRLRPEGLPSSNVGHVKGRDFTSLE